MLPGAIHHLGVPTAFPKTREKPKQSVGLRSSAESMGLTVALPETKNKYFNILLKRAGSLSGALRFVSALCPEITAKRREAHVRRNAWDVLRSLF